MVPLSDDLYVHVWRDVHANNCNTYLINGSKKILIDPGYEYLFNTVEQSLASISVTPEQIDVVLVTHGHPDHFEGISAFGPSVLKGIHKADYELYLGRTGLPSSIQEPDFFLQDGNLRVGEEQFRIIHTPGHSPGSIALYWPRIQALFTGDVIFYQGIGRTDLPGGNGMLLKRSIQKLMELECSYLLPGHGDIIMGGEAIKANFRLVETSWFSYL